jgi:hypothetical protein
MPWSRVARAIKLTKLPGLILQSKRRRKRTRTGKTFPIDSKVQLDENAPIVGSLRHLTRRVQPDLAAIPVGKA